MDCGVAELDTTERLSLTHSLILIDPHLTPFLSSNSISLLSLRLKSKSMHDFSI